MMRTRYGDHRNPEAALAWLWKFIDGAKTAGELYGRALMVTPSSTPPGSSSRQASGFRHPLELAQGHRRQGPDEACRPTRPGLVEQARAGRQARPTVCLTRP